MKCNNCGSNNAEYIKDNVTYGHGNYGYCHRIECKDCGMSTIGIDDHGGYITDASEKVHKLWNQFFGKNRGKEQ